MCWFRSSLEAEVTVYAEPALAEYLLAVGDELRFVLITSAAKVVAGLEHAPGSAVATDLAGLKLVIESSASEKCVRCWHHRPEVGSHAVHPQLCDRCIENVDGDGEVRQYA